MNDIPNQESITPVPDRSTESGDIRTRQKHAEAGESWRPHGDSATADRKDAR